MTTSANNVLSSKLKVASAPVSPHPHLSGWNMAWLPVLPLVKSSRTGYRQSLVGLLLTGIQTEVQSVNKPSLVRLIADQIELLPEQTLLGLDLSGIANMDGGLWHSLGPGLSEHVINGKLGKAKRLLYMLGENTWLANDLQFAFENIARARFRAQPNAAHPNLAVLTPGIEQGYCGVLAPIYADTLQLVNQRGSLSSLELYQLLQRRYRLAPAHADQCLALLAQLGLVHRHSSIRQDGVITYDLNAKGYALNVSEELMRQKAFKLLESTEE